MAIREVDVDELAALLDGPGPVRLIDVREPDEYVSGHVPTAVSVPLADVPQRLAEFTGEGTTIVICKSGGRSMHACELAAAHGIDAVNVVGGTMAWRLRGREVVAGDRPS